MPPHSLTKSPAFKRLKQLHSQTSKKSLLWYFDVGKCVLSLHPLESREYGESRIQSLAEALGKSGSYANELWKTRTFAKTFDRAEVKVLCRPDPETGFSLSWWHVIHLLSLEGEDREQYQSECLDKQWSSKELHRRIKAHREPQGRGGRRFRKPKNVETALRQLIGESQVWMRRYHEVWFARDNPALPFDPKEYASGEVTKLVEEAIDLLETIKLDAKNGLDLLKTVGGAKKKPSRKRERG